jgi:hypothetical protein
LRLRTAVHRAIAALPLTASDQAVAELARHQAAAIDDDPDALKRIGPQLLETLAELGLTPKARASVFGKGRGSNDGSRGKLAELRSIRP